MLTAHEGYAFVGHFECGHNSQRELATGRKSAESDLDGEVWKWGSVGNRGLVGKFAADGHVRYVLFAEYGCLPQTSQTRSQ